MPVYQAGGRVRLFYRTTTQHKDGMHTTTIRWRSVKSRLPNCDLAPNTFGVEVLIWPPKHDKGNDNHMRTAFFGRRVTDAPSFYKYGAVVDGVTHWAYMPEGPPDEKRSQKRVQAKRSRGSA